MFYLFLPRVLSLANTLRRPSNRRTAAIWTAIVLATLIGVGALCVRLFQKIEAVDTVSPLIGAVDAFNRFFDRAPTVGEMLNRTVLMMFTFSLMAMLLLSNVITALSTFFSSEELDLVFSSPLGYRAVFFSKFAETMLQSSWMVFLLLVPFVGALGWVYHAPARFWLLFWLPLLPFLAMCTAAGIAITLFLARAFPVGKTRNLLRFISVMGAGVLLLLFRIMRPELLVSPDRFRDLLQMLQTPWNPHLEKVPSGWMSREILWLMHFPHAAQWWDHVLLWGGAALGVLAVYWASKRYHLDTWQAHQEAEAAPDEDPASGGRVPGEGPVDHALRFLPLDTRAIVAKDVRVFYRSPVLWTQVMLMVVIMVIYLYNIYLLPLKSIRGMAPIFTEWLAFFNIGFVAFVLVALALRFGFPAVSMEGLGFYLIHASPLGIRRYVLVKFWSNFVPLLIVSTILVSASDWILGVRRLMFWVSLADIVLFTLVISSFALAHGAVYHDFRRVSVSEIPSSFGGMVFMVATLLTICLVLAIQAVPFWLLTIHALSVARPAAMYVALTVACGALSVAVCLFAAWAGLRWTTRCLEYLEVE